MSVLIKGMEMPKGCFFCPMRIKIDPDTIRCLATGNDFEETLAGTIERRNNGNCPLIEIPTPHGDLIDRDEVIKAIGRRPHVGIGINDDDDEFDSGMSCQWGHDTGTIKDMPAIIEAEGRDT